MVEDKTAPIPEKKPASTAAKAAPAQQPTLEGVSAEAPATQSTKPSTQDGSESILNVVKRDAKKIIAHIKVLPKEHKAKLFIGCFLILSSIIAYNSYGMMFIIFGFFVPCTIGAIWIISAYNEKDFIHELTKEKTPKPQVGDIVIQKEYDEEPTSKK